MSDRGDWRVPATNGHLELELDLHRRTDDARLDEDVGVLLVEHRLADELLRHRDRHVVGHTQVRQVVQEPAPRHITAIALKASLVIYCTGKLYCNLYSYT